ncbi:hypothetical protein HYY69_04935 [Candidatus Woesearchaeota archaeon]|nr:hypothetical protein [Candidatus Woesearchaeota archaeon]
MSRFNIALKEVYDTQNKVIILTTFLKTVIVFLLAYSILILIHFYKNMAFIIALFYFAYTVQKEINKKSLKEVEGKNPFLKEMLSTAADNVHVENFMVLKLQEQVFQGIKEIRISSFINLKKLGKLFAFISLFAIFNIIIGVNGWQILDLEGILQDRGLSFNIRNSLLKHQLHDSLLDLDISLDDLNQDVQIQEIGNKNQLKKAEALPDELFKASDKTFEELLSKKKRIYIRKYFSQVRDLQPVTGG